MPGLMPGFFLERGVLKHVFCFEKLFLGQLFTDFVDVVEIFLGQQLITVRKNQTLASIFGSRMILIMVSVASLKPFSTAVRNSLKI